MYSMRRPRTPLTIMDVISPYLTCTQMNTRLSIARTVAGYHCERRPPVEGGGDDQNSRAGEFEDVEGHPGSAWQRTKRTGRPR